jgi:hypothetical protein
MQKGNDELVGLLPAVFSQYPLYAAGVIVHAIFSFSSILEGLRGSELMRPISMIRAVEMVSLAGGGFM